MIVSIDDPTYSINWGIYLIALILASIPVIGFYGLSIGHQSRKMKVNAAEDLITAGE